MDSIKVKVLPVLRDDEITQYTFECPGCKCNHAYYVSGPIKWEFNGSLENPTFTPSLKNTYPDGKVCHLFVTNGKIEYCGDCFHELKGQKIEMVLEDYSITNNSIHSKLTA